MDFELKLADLELWRLGGLVVASEIERDIPFTTAGSRSSEFCGLTSGEFGLGLELNLGLSCCWRASFPMEARAATSKAEMAALAEAFALVSTYMRALICWLKLSA